MSIKIEIEGFNTKAEAEEFLSWYSGQGEQDAAIWFECRKDEEIISCDFMECTTNWPLEWEGETLKMAIEPKY